VLYYCVYFSQIMCVLGIAWKLEGWVTKAPKQNAAILHFYRKGIFLFPCFTTTEENCLNFLAIITSTISHSCALWGTKFWKAVFYAKLKMLFFPNPKLIKIKINKKNNGLAWHVHEDTKSKTKMNAAALKSPWWFLEIYNDNPLLYWQWLWKVVIWFILK